MKKQNMNTTTETTENAMLSNNPVIGKKDVTGNVEHIDAAPMNTTADGSPVVDGTPAAKTPAEINAERRNAAKKDAAEKWRKKYNGNPAAAILARETNDGRAVADIRYTYTDTDGKKCKCAAVLSLSALLSTDARKTATDAKKTITAGAVAFHNARNAGTDADGQRARADAKKAVLPAVVSLLSLYGAPVTETNVKTADISALCETVYKSNADGNDDANAGGVFAAAAGIVRRLLLARERRNDYAIRAEKKAAADAEKKAAKDATTGGKKKAATGKKKAAKK